MKIHLYTFNNAEHDDIYLCEKHNEPPMYGMWVHDYIEEDRENGVCCQVCDLQGIFFNDDGIYD